MKIARELAEIFDHACKDVRTWEGWQRSLDPQGHQNTKDAVQEIYSTKADDSESDKLRRSA